MQQFDILQLDAGVDDIYALHVYKENMDYNIYFQLSLYKPAIANTLTKWKKQVVIIGKTFNWIQLKHSKTTIPQGLCNNCPVFTTTGTQLGLSTLMDTRVVQSQHVHTDDQICYNCNEKGHIFHNCIKPRHPCGPPCFNPFIGCTTYPPPRSQNRKIPLALTMDITLVMSSSTSTLVAPS